MIQSQSNNILFLYFSLLEITKDKIKFLNGKLKKFVENCNILNNKLLQTNSNKNNMNKPNLDKICHNEMVADEDNLEYSKISSNYHIHSRATEKLSSDFPKNKKSFSIYEIKNN
jgi:hypothetical protein